MSMYLAILIIVIISVALILYIIKGAGKSQAEKRLRDECRKAVNMPVKEADRIIEESIQRLKEKHPGRSEEWYLDKFLYDLQRDRS